MEETDASAVTSPLSSEAGVQVKLKKEVTLLNAITLIVGAVIGSGIFVSPTGIIEKSGSIGFSLFIWLGCGLIALLGCLCYAELGTCVKKSGAEYAYLFAAFGPIPAFLFSWTAILIIRPSAGAIIAMIFAEYVSKPFYPDCEAPVALIKILASFCLGKLSFVFFCNSSVSVFHMYTFSFSRLRVCTWLGCTPCSLAATDWFSYSQLHNRSQVKNIK